MKSMILIGLGFLLFLCACSKGGLPPSDNPHIVDNTDSIPPVITINSPTPDQNYSNGENIIVQGKVTDLGLYRGNIRISNDADNSTIKMQAYEIHGLREYNFTFTHTSNVSASSNYTVTVWFEDHGLNITTKTIKIKVNN